MIRACFAFTEREKSQPSWQFEPLRTRRSWIEQQRLPEPFILRLMRMTEDADVWSGAIEKRSSLLGQLSSFTYNMSDRDMDAIQLNNGLCREAALFIFIDIARDSGHRSDHLKLLNDRSFTDITSMDNMIHAMEMPHNRRVEEAVGIGNDPDADRPRAIHGLPPL